MSLVLAADYRVPDFDRWWAKRSDLPALRSLGAHHVVVYRSLEDSSRVFVTMGVRERGPVDALLRSPTLFAWFDSAGVEEIPPLFIGEVVEKVDLAEALADGVQAGAVTAAAILPVDQPDRLRAYVHRHAARLAASGVRRFWIYRALDDQAEAMILLEIASEPQAERYIRRADPDVVARFMSETGVGPYPPLFIGRLLQTIELLAAPEGPD